MAEYKSKTVVVHSPADVIFNKATDLQGVVSSIPENVRQNITVQDGILSLEYAGFVVKIKVTDSQPFSKVVYSDVEAPFHFTVSVDLDSVEGDDQSTRLTVSVDAELNLMMKMMLGGKIKEYLDMAVTAVSNGGTVL